MGYTRDAIKGVSWLGAFRLFMRSFSFIKIAIIARILSPAQFGISDIALLILALVEVFTETGINIFLTAENENIDNYIDTAWIVSIIRGFFIAAIIYFSAPFISLFFRSPSCMQLLVLASFVPIFRGFINPSVAKFLKDLKYKKSVYYRASIFAVETSGMIIAVFITKQPIGIVWGIFFGAVFELFISFITARPIPRFNFKKILFMNIIKKGKWLTLSGIFNYLYHNLDNIIVGRILGTSSLGLYQRAYSISMLPISEVSDTFSSTTFPIYVKIANDSKRLQAAFYKTLFFVSILVIPASVIFFIFPKIIIELVLGKKWIMVAPALQVLAFFGSIHAITSVTVGLFYSLKKQEVITKITLVSLIGLVITIVPFINKWGIVGAGLSALFGTIITVPLVIYHVKKTFSELE
jgi:lipopolysaccharide exporter